MVSLWLLLFAFHPQFWVGPPIHQTAPAVSVSQPAPVRTVPPRYGMRPVNGRLGH